MDTFFLKSKETIYVKKDFGLFTGSTGHAADADTDVDAVIDGNGFIGILLDNFSKCS